MLKQRGVKQGVRVFENYLDLACSTNKGGRVVSGCDVLKVCPVDTVQRSFLGNLRFRQLFRILRPFLELKSKVPPLDAVFSQSTASDGGVRMSKHVAIVICTR